MLRLSRDRERSARLAVCSSSVTVRVQRRIPGTLVSTWRGAGGVKHAEREVGFVGLKEREHGVVLHDSSEGK